MLTISKLLDFLSLIGIIALLVLYLFLKWQFFYLAWGLIILLFIRVLSQTLKARYYEKEYNKLRSKTQDIIDSI
ncbi:MAG: hypothetical protein IJ748_04990 [Bacteroidales bacterium]|nr:hypothetical protein [Bacteroidales bacterium]